MSGSDHENGGCKRRIVKFWQATKSWWCWLLLVPRSISPLEWRTAGFMKWASAGRVGSQPEAADFNLAVTLVAPWEEYVLDLSPDFKETAQDAIKHVIPNTAAIEEKILDTWKVSAEAARGAAGGSGAPKKKTPEEEGEDKPEDKDKDKDKDKPEHNEADKGNGQKGGAAPIGKDPMLEYAAATALYQEIKLLNRYVADAALRRDHRAYVIRLQMSVVPFARHLPFDVYTNISFFPETKKEAGAKPTRYRAEVIPLLVTDNLESAIKSRTVDSMRELALTLSFLQPGVRGGVRLGRKREEFERALGADLNSLLTVGRVSDNTLQIRLGAARDATSSSGYAMIPRTHNITVLVLVPSEFAELPGVGAAGPRITAVSKTQLRDAKTGTELPHQTQDDRRRLVEDVCRSDVLRQQRGDVADRLLQNVFANNFDAFEQVLKDARFCKVLKDNYLNSDWRSVLDPATVSHEAPFDRMACALRIPPLQRPELVAELRNAFEHYAKFEKAVPEEDGKKEDARNLWRAIVADRAVIEHVRLVQLDIVSEVEIRTPHADVLARFKEHVEYAESTSSSAGRHVFAAIKDQVRRSDAVQELWIAVAHFASFERELKDTIAQPFYVQDLWCNVVETLGKSEFAAVRFELPIPARLPPPQNVFVVDDKHATTVYLQGGAGLNENGVTATLIIRVKNIGELRIGASDINILAGGHGMTITFPSLAAWKISDLEREGRRLHGSELHLTYGEGRKWNSTQQDERESQEPARYPVVFYVQGKPVDLADRPAHGRAGGES